jgi:uncharacterized protein YutE (UPF0331/DUF86 family)/predicted nucleotidyltransferase
MNDQFEEVRKYCEVNENITLALIFGSTVREMAGEDSDLDIAIYLKDASRDEEVWTAIGALVNKTIDLIVLNDAPATLVSNILKTGLPIVIKDRKLYWDLYLGKTLEAEDFNEFTESFWQIYRRSASLAPEDNTRLIATVQFLESEFQEIEGFKGLSYKEYYEEKSKRRNVERWAENVVNATIDIAKIILASERKEIPKTYEKALVNFGIVAGLNEEKAVKLSSFARLRNILAHHYLDITFDRIKGFIKDAPPIYAAVFDFLHEKLD